MPSRERVFIYCTGGLDFLSDQINVTFVSGQVVATVQVSTIEDFIIESREAFRVKLSTSDSSVAIGGDITVYIMDTTGM